jgi:3-oxoadipate enol-lactonase
VSRRAWPPEPPNGLPPARTVELPGRGEVFLRDTGGEGQPVMLLHGWMVSADLNWWGTYGALADAGYRVLAIDHRGHGRGMRAMTPFKLLDCASDVAATLERLNLAPAVVVGYSLGGAVAQLTGRDHPDAVAGLVLCATAQQWQDPPTRRAWRAMGALGMMLSVAPRATYSMGFRRAGYRDSRATAWMQSEMMRNSARDVAEAGRELGRFDSRPWLSSLSVPVATVITTKDDIVPTIKQRELATAAGGVAFEAHINHLENNQRGKDFNPALLEAIAAVSSPRTLQSAAAGGGG